MRRLRFRPLSGARWALMFALVQFGCSSSDGDQPRADAGVEQSSVVIGTTDQITALDPAEAYQTSTYELLLNINSTLYRYDASSNDYQPALAAGDPVIEDGGRSWTIALREGLTFADGTPFNADAVVYSINRVIARGGSPSFLVTAWVESISAVDATHVRFRLKQPVGFFQALLSSATYAPVNKSQYPEDKLLNTPFTEAAQAAEWKDSNVDQNSKDPKLLLGLGPYRIASITTDPSKGQFGGYKEITLEANPGFSPAPKTKNVVVKFYDTSEQLEQALRANEIQVAWNTLSTPSLEALAADSAFDVVESNGVVTEFLNFNFRVPPFDDPDVRKAVAYAVDREAMADQIWSVTGKPLYSMVPEGLWSYKKSYPSADLEQTKSLLTAAGYNDTDNKLVFSLTYATDFPANQPMSEMVKAALEDTGMVEVTLDGQPSDVFFGALLQRDGDNKATHTIPVFWMGWTPDYSDPDNFVYTFAHSGEDLLGISYGSTEMDALLDSARSATELEQRRGLYEQVQDRYAQDMLTVPAIQRTKQAVVRSGVTLEPPGIDTLLRYETIDVP